MPCDVNEPARVLETRHLSLVTCHFLSERLDRLRLGDFGAAIFAGAPGIVPPEIEHGLAEVFNDVAAVKIDVLDERAAFLAVKDDVLMFAGWSPALHHNADSVGWTHGRVRHIWRDEEGFTFADEMIDDPVAFADAHFNVALELIEVLLGINEMKIVPGVWAFDDHDEKIAAIIEIPVADGRLKQVAVCFDPVVDIDGRQHFCGRAASNGW